MPSRRLVAIFGLACLGVLSPTAAFLVLSAFLLHLLNRLDDVQRDNATLTAAAVAATLGHSQSTRTNTGEAVDTPSTAPDASPTEPGETPKPTGR